MTQRHRGMGGNVIPQPAAVPLLVLLLSFRSEAEESAVAVAFTLPSSWAQRRTPANSAFVVAFAVILSAAKDPEEPKPTQTAQTFSTTDPEGLVFAVILTKAPDTHYAVISTGAPGAPYIDFDVWHRAKRDRTRPSKPASKALAVAFSLQPRAQSKPRIRFSTHTLHQPQKAVAFAAVIPQRSRGICCCHCR